MIIRCEQCTTTYHLDQTLLEPFGSKVRCTRCGHTFWMDSPAFAETSIHQEPNAEMEEPFRIINQEEQAASLELQKVKKKSFLGPVLIILLVILLIIAGRFFYVQYQHPNWGLEDLVQSVFFIPVDPEGNQKISLINIKKYFRENPKIGRFFIIEGDIKNGYTDTRQLIKIRGSLRTAENKIAVSREVHAGWTLTTEELATLSFDEIAQLAVTQRERFSPNIPVLPGKTTSFMILFPPVPPGSTQVSIEVISSQGSPILPSRK